MQTWKYIFFFIFSFFFTNSYALTDYQIEIIVFSQMNAEALMSEHWDLLGGSPIPLENALDLNTMKNPELKKVDPNKYVLKEEESRLKKNPLYRVLLHVAWRESLFQAATKTIIHLYGGQLYAQPGAIQHVLTNDQSAPYNANQSWEVDGTFAVQLDHYFTTSLNLTAAIPFAELHNFTKENYNYKPGSLAYFSIQHNRRTRSQEINYIDHPLYGVLFKIIPV